MKESELEEHLNCNFCNTSIMSTGLPLFYVVKMRRYGVHLDRVKRRVGLGMLLTPHLARAMGPDDDLAEPIGEEVKFTLCENCSTSKYLALLAIAEKERERNDAAKLREKENDDA